MGIRRGRTHTDRRRGSLLVCNSEHARQCCSNNTDTQHKRAGKGGAERDLCPADFCRDIAEVNVCVCVCVFVCV